MRKVDPVKHGGKRAEILAAAERCFGRSGFYRATIAQICDEAAISPGHLYHYFASKEAIIAAINQGHVYHFLRKPWQPVELQHAVHEAAAEYDRLVEEAEEKTRLRGELEALTRRVHSLEEEVERLRGQRGG